MTVAEERPFTIAAAQAGSAKGDIRENVRRHLSLARLAAEHGADVVVFPELSLTGYEPTLASGTALGTDDASLSPLKDLAGSSQLTIVAGCPISSPCEKPFIGAVIFQPGQPTAVYRKRFLGEDEARHFIAADDTVVCRSRGRSIGIAICADINHAAHAADACAQGAKIYTAGVMMTPEYIAEAETNMTTYAKRHRVLAVMANHASPTGGYESAGRSAIWDEAGELIARADRIGEAIVLASSTSGDWTGRVLRC